MNGDDIATVITALTGLVVVVLGWQTRREARGAKVVAAEAKDQAVEATEVAGVAADGVVEIVPIVHAIDRAVNQQPASTPKMVENVKDIHEEQARVAAELAATKRAGT